MSRISAMRLHRGEAALHARQCPAERDRRPREVREIGVEGDEGSQGDALVHDRLASQPEHDEPADAGDQPHERHGYGLHARQAQATAEVLVVQPAEVGDLAGLHGIGAHHGDPAEVLLNLRRQHAELLLHLGGAHLDLVDEPLGDQDEKRKRCQGIHREPRVDQPHGGERADEGERGPRHHDGAEAGELADGRDVAGRARHEIADAVRVVEGRRHGQQMREEIVAEVSLHPLSRAEHGESGAHPRRAVRRGEEQDDHDVARQRRSARVAEPIDRVLDRPRDAERDARGGDQAQNPIA
jgi:hypothetical protein